MMMRSLFVREEDGRLIIGSGVFPEWLDDDGGIFFGPTLVPGGSLSIGLKPTADGLRLRIKSDIRGTPVPCRVEVPGYQIEEFDTSHKSRILTRNGF